MSNFLLKDPDCVFIHIPKTGGLSIRKGVWKGNYDGPVFGYIPEEWQHLFSFAFVRHPLQRLVSAYNMFTSIANGDSEMTIESFLDIVTDESIIFDERRKTLEERIRHHTIPQTHPFNCLDKAQVVGRQECFDSDFSVITEGFGVDRIAPKLNMTSGIHWSLILDKVSKDRATEYYREDFKLLGYLI